MTFELVRIGWPNTAAILALALIPIVSLANVIKHDAETSQFRPIATATFYSPDSAAVVTAILPETSTK